MANFFYDIFRRLLGMRRGAAVTAAVLAAYTAMVGAEPAVVQAAILGVLSLLGRQVGRRQDGINSLGAAAGGMVFVNPLLLHSASFRLSFTATLGLVLFA